MGLAAFVILIIIIFQTYQLLVNPTNEENMTKIKRSFIYIAIGILVIGA
jgi:ABC-type xylose transport system permease subunit